MILNGRFDGVGVEINAAVLFNSSCRQCDTTTRVNILLGFKDFLKTTFFCLDVLNANCITLGTLFVSNVIQWNAQQKCCLICLNRPFPNPVP